MKKLKQMLQALVIAMLSFLPVSCHYNYSAPFLWAGQTSVSHQACITLWVITIGALVWGLCVAVEVWRKGWEKAGT